MLDLKRLKTIFLKVWDSASAIIEGLRQWVRGTGSGTDLGLSKQPLHVSGKGTETDSGGFWAVITLLSGLDQCHWVTTMALGQTQIN